ncbi:hypothetical protein HNQ77_001576 [Silvibacterium bohemicum]|uniref:DUF4280 domain-containing protein n=1 Tax=Silvibacterium bohemicum TaxID=1577686 RepID=A0A841JT03_9BACT|nr:DUF4280 domain-containing protein [Silvibacterium bohemicum]MBB6143627.1 hypothetical protein [Silvibacterium bohemicum]
MAMQVCMGASIACSFGAAPGSLIVLPENQTFTGTPAATIMDNKPMVNIPTFGMCSSPSNPEVITATAAALGVLTPMPCVPATVAPWAPGAPTVLIGNMPALDSTSKLMCTWAGIIQISDPGQATVQIP